MMINFGIDLGTTNSAIAKFEKGAVEIFKNPINLKQTLPSVVAFRNKRIIVGDKAREYIQRDPQNVFGSFKRKMGTSETYYVTALEEEKNAINLSAYVLKELKNFVHTNEVVDAAVITIPASFDTLQSNATKKAGYEAGFKEVVLLQEPIAASLAYANKEEAAFEEGQWLVYDLGGGTFDVALVQIKEGEMKIIDHEGDNFLGGTDFDKVIVEELLIPYLEKEGQFKDLERALKSNSGRYNKLYQILLLKAEEAKIALTNYPVAEIEFETEDDNGNLIDGFLELHRNDFNRIIAPFIEQTVQQIFQILDRNNLTAKAMKYVLMVGGSTYIPYIREQVGKALQIEVNCNIDPTTAVAVGAAFYASSKPKMPPNTNLQTTGFEPKIKVKTAYQKATQETTEYFTALVEGNFNEVYFRITRKDGGYDSGLQRLTSERITAQLPLLKHSHNFFDLLFFDKYNNPIEANVPEIGITQGKYNVVGQPLPNDICLEVDDVENATTALEVVFEKNTILPTQRTLIKTVTKTIKKGSDDRITINIVEGPNYALPAANQTIGFISISGKELERDLVRGSDVEITLEMTESRDLKIECFLMLSDQSFENIFTPSERQVNIERLSEELLALYQKVNEEIRDAEQQESFETASQLNVVKKEIRTLSAKTNKLSFDDSTDERFQLDSQKRALAQKLDNLTKDKHIVAIKMAYLNAKKRCQAAIEENTPSASEVQRFEQLLQKEKSTLATNSRLKIENLANQFHKLRGDILWRDPEHVKFLFYYAQSYESEFTDQAKGKEFIEKGMAAIEENNIDKLKIYVNGLFGLLPNQNNRSIEKGGTGIG